VIVEANLTGAVLPGIDRRRLIKHRFRRFVGPEDLERWDRHFIAVQRSADKQTCDLQLLKGDGSWFNARVESRLIEREKKDPVIRMAIIDITVQKRAEDELILISDDIRAANEKLTPTGDEPRRNEGRLTASLEEKEVLLSEIRHRVKNNLTAFISLLSLDGSTEDTPAGRTPQAGSPEPGPEHGAHP
jgi:PAS domain S-box-containing protein